MSVAIVPSQHETFHRRKDVLEVRPRWKGSLRIHDQGRKSLVEFAVLGPRDLKLNSDPS